MRKILIVEDDCDLRRAVSRALEKEGYEVICAGLLEEAEQNCKNEEIQLILLDVNLPDGEGFSFCRRVKNEKEIPVLFLTARDLEEDALSGYEMGAEDYVTKPFSMKILLKKIDVILKRTQPKVKPLFRDGYLTVDFENAKVFIQDKECPVTPTELKLLRQLIVNKGQLLTYDILLERLWDNCGQYVDKHTLAVNVNRLRGKIEDEQHKYISNIYGMGYQWIG